MSGCQRWEEKALSSSWGSMGSGFVRVPGSPGARVCTGPCTGRVRQRRPREADALQAQRVRAGGAAARSSSRGDPQPPRGGNSSTSGGHGGRSRSRQCVRRGSAALCRAARCSVRGSGCGGAAGRVGECRPSPGCGRPLVSDALPAGGLGRGDAGLESPLCAWPRWG